MAVFTPIYRGRLYKPRSVDPNEATLLTPRAGALHSDPFRIATARGVPGYQPYMSVPKGRRGRVDPRTKKTDLGSRTVTVVDPFINAATSTNAERWFTAYFGDEGAKAAMAMCRWEEDESLDGGVTWTRIYTGRVTNVKTKDTLEDILTITDLMGDLDRDVFVRDPIDVSYARRLPLLPLGLSEDFGALPQTTPELPGHVRSGNATYPYQIATGRSEMQGGSNVDNQDTQGHSKVPQALADLASKVVRNRTGKTFVFPEQTVRVRVDHGGTISWWWLGDFIAERVGEHDTVHWRPKTIRMVAAPTLNVGTPAWPATGQAITWRFYFADSSVSERNPILIDPVDPVTLLADLVDGKFGPPHPATGAPRPAAPREVASWAALAGRLNPWQGIITEKSTARTWAAEYVCQMYQLALSMNGAGECVLLDLRRGDSAEGLPEITDAEIVSAKGSESFEQNTADAITRIVAPTDYITQLDRTPDFAKIQDEYPDVPRGMLRVERDPPMQFLALGDPRTVDFPDKATTIRMNGLPVLLIATPPPENEVVITHTKRVATFREQLAHDLFALYSHGPQYFAIDARRTGVAETTQPGDRRIVTTSKLPNPATTLRGGSRVGLCLERSENGPSCTLVFLDLGLPVTSDPPELPDPPAQDVEDCAHTVTLAVTLPTTGVQVVVAYAVTVIGGARPADTSTDWIVGARLTADGDAVITGLPSGSRIHLRTRTEPLSGSTSPFPSAWTAPTPGFVETCGIAAITGCTLEDVDGGRLVTWTGGDPELPVTVKVDGVVVETLDPGVTEWNPVGYGGTVTLEQPDGFGGTVVGCSLDLGAAPDCVLPTVTAIADATTGIVELSLVDPQGRVISVEFRHRSGSGEWTDYAEATAEAGGTYRDTVGMVPGYPSRVEWRITLVRCDGTIGEQLDGRDLTLDETPPEPPPTAGGDGLCVDVPFHAAGNNAEGFVATSALTEVTGDERIVFDTRGYAFVRWMIQFDGSDPLGPQDSYLVAECRNKGTDEAFRPFGLTAGPAVPMDSTRPRVRWSDWVALAPEALGDLEMRRRTVGGDDATIVNPKHCRLQFIRSLPEDESETPQEPEPGDRQVIAHFLGDTGKIVSEGGVGSVGTLDELVLEGLPTDTAAFIAYMLSQGWVLKNTVVGVSSNTAEVVTDIVDVGTQAVHFKIVHDAWNGGEIIFEKTYTGLIPGDIYTVTSRTRTQNRSLYFDPTLTVNGIGGPYVPSGSDPEGAFTGKMASGPVAADGTVKVKFGMEALLGIGFNKDVWFDGSIKVEGNVPSAVGELIRWEDQSGNENDAVWTAGPHGTDEGDAVALIGGAVLHLPSGILDGFRAVDVFAVVTAAADPNSGNNVLWGLGLQPSRYPDGAGHILEGAGRLTAGDAGNPTPALTAVRLYHVQVTEAGVTVRLGGVVLATFPPGALVWNSDLSIGGGVTFGELLIIGGPEPLTESETDHIDGEIIGRHPEIVDPPTVPPPPAPPGTPLPPIVGIKGYYGSAHYQDVDEVPPYTGVYGTTLWPPSNVPSQLSFCTTNNIKLFPYLLGNGQMQPSGLGSFSYTMWRNNLTGYGAQKSVMQTAWEAHVLAALIVADDIDLVRRWGAPIPSATLDRMAKDIKEVLGFPIPIFIRQSPTLLEARRYNFVYIDGCVAQGPNPMRGGTVENMIVTQEAAAARMNKRLVYAGNLVNGGDGSSGIPGTEAGTRWDGKVFYFQSATDINRDMVALARRVALGKADFLGHWWRGWSGGIDNPYTQLPAIRAANDNVIDALGL